MEAYLETFLETCGRGLWSTSVAR